MIDKRVPFLAIFSLVRPVIQFDTENGLQGSWMAEHKIDVFGQYFVQPAPAISGIRFDSQQIGNTDHRENFPIVQYGFAEASIKPQLGLGDQSWSRRIGQTARSAVHPQEDDQRDHHDDKHPEGPGRCKKVQDGFEHFEGPE